jgi:hypothetical protein
VLLEREVLVPQAVQVHPAHDDIAPCQPRVERLGQAELGCHSLQRLGGDERHRGLHAAGLAEEPVSDDALPRDELDLVGKRRRMRSDAIGHGAVEVVVVTRRDDERLQLHGVAEVAVRHGATHSGS